MKRTSRANAFSLIELIAVIAIMITLAALIIPKLTAASYKRDVMVCVENLKKLGNAFHQYVLENDGYAPFNPNCNEENDNMWSWEVAYLLGPYMGDKDHAKFESGEWMSIRCPGNKCDFYRTGTMKDGSGNNYGSTWQNRQAPLLWPADTATGETVGTSCSSGQQVMDYQYNQSLGGTMGSIRALAVFAPWYADHPANYKLDFIVKYSSEAVIFCDIHFANVYTYDASGKLYKDRQIYSYPGASSLTRYWGAHLNDTKQTNGSAPTTVIADAQAYRRTNELIHEGKGINAVFVDGHVEFLTSEQVYNHNKSRLDDLLNWGISYPITDPTNGTKSLQIPGIHGYRREPMGSDQWVPGDSDPKGGWCIEHECRKGVGTNTVTDKTLPDGTVSASGTAFCFLYDDDGRV